MNYRVLGLATIVLAGGMLLATGCGPKPKKEVAPTINLDSLRAAEEAKRLAAEKAAAEEARRLAELEAAKKAEAEAARLKAEQEAKDKASLKVVYFDYDKSNIRPDMNTDAQFNAGLLKRYDKWRVSLEGHADERGTNEYNLALGDRRAQSVKKFLTEFGIAGDRVSTISFGEERPAVKGNGEASWSKNRRVEFNAR